MCQLLEETFSNNGFQFVWGGNDAYFSAVVSGENMNVEKVQQFINEAHSLCVGKVKNCQVFPPTKEEIENFKSEHHALVLVA